MRETFNSQIKAVKASPKLLRRSSFTLSRSKSSSSELSDEETRPMRRRFSLSSSSKSAPITDDTAPVITPAKKSQVVPTNDNDKAWGLGPPNGASESGKDSPYSPPPRMDAAADAFAAATATNAAHRCAPGTGSMHQWVYNETELAMFHHIDLRDMSVYIDHDLDPSTEPIMVLDKV